MSLPAPPIVTDSRFRVQSFRPEHYIELHRGYQARVGLGTHETTAHVYYDRGPGISAFIDGQIAACAGVVLLWPGVGEAWALVNDLGARRTPMAAFQSLLGLAGQHGPTTYDGLYDAE